MAIAKKILLAGAVIALAIAPAGGGWPDVPGCTTWGEYVKTPDTHPYLNNWSYAGYRFGERPIPHYPVVADVRKFGATGNGKSDDTAAIKKAIDAACAKVDATKPGAVYFPPGEYRISNFIGANTGVVLRGIWGSGADIQPPPSG